MKRIIRLISSLAIAFALVAVMSTSVFAAGGQVTYKGDAGYFIFELGSKYSPTNLFTEQYKGVMPGDTISHTINVKNDATDAVDVEIFMKSLGASDLLDEGYGVTADQSADFLKHMNLTVTAESGAKLFEAPADQTGGLTDWVSLGKFKSGADVNLTVNLEVPAEMGNDCQAQIGAIDWVFKTVETPAEPEELIDDASHTNTDDDGDTTVDGDSKVKTGDDTKVLLIAGICIAALLGAVITILAGKRKKQ